MKKVINPILWCLSGFGLAIIIIAISYFTGTQSQVKYRTVKQQTIDATFRYMATLAKQKALSWPIKFEGEPNSGFGYRKNPVHKFIGGLLWGFHSGVDLPGTNGQPVNPAADGVVIATGKNQVGGKFVILDHDDGVTTSYYHLSKILCNTGDLVIRTDIIGLVGKTGITTGNHIHLQIEYNGIPVNPVFWICGD